MSGAASRPQPRVTPETAAYWAAGVEGRLLVGACDSCARLHHPPQAVCPHCWAEAGLRQVSGRGTVESFSVVHRTREPFFAAQSPYVVVQVRLEEGVAMISNLVECPPDAARVGMPVQVTFEVLAADVAVPLFRPAP